MSNSFSITHEKFEGPLDALLSLIEGKKMEISDIALADVAEDFAHYVQDNTTLSLYDRAAAIVILATLMLIKSRALLPSFALTDEEELAAHELQKRLALYAQVKHGTKTLAELWRIEPMVGMSRMPARAVVFAPSTDLTLAGIHQVLATLTRALPVVQKREEATVAAVIRIEDMMDSITKRIQRAVSASFNDMTKGGDRATVIVSFLAILELVRHGVLSVRQDARFGDIALNHEQA